MTVAVSEPTAPSGRETVLMALAQGSLGLIGAVLSLLVAQYFGRDVETDAFFAAYGFYSVGVTLAQTFRLTAVPRLVRAPGPETATRLLAAVAVIAAVAAVPMLLLADPLGGLLVDEDPGGVAPDTLRILWLTLAGQLLGAMLATILAVRSAFTTIAVATLATSCVSIGVFAALQSSVVTLACLTPLILSLAASVFAVVELLAQGELRRLALLGALQVAATFGAALAGSAIAGTPGIAAGLSLVAVGTALVQLRWAFGPLWRKAAARMGQAIGRESLVLAVAFLPAALLPGDLAGFVLAAVLVTVATLVAWPRERRVLLGVVRPARGAGT